MSTLALPAFRSAAPLPAGAALYVAVVNALGLAAFIPILDLLPGADIGVVAAWTAACLAGELLNMPTPTRRGQTSMATAFHLAMALVLAPPEFLPALWISRVAVKGVIQRQPWYRVVFNASQVSLAVIVAWIAWQFLGPPASGVTAPAADGGWRSATAVLAFGAAGLAYYLVNTLTVSGVIALTGGGRLLEAWRTNYGYAVEMQTTAALFLLAPGVAASVAVFGPIGLAAIVAPVAAIHAAGRSFRRLEGDQRAVIEHERLSAKSEISTQVGYEMTEALTSISGAIQLLARRWPNVSDEEFRRRVADIRATTDRIGALSRGLTEFSRGGFCPDWIDPATFVTRGVAFLKTEGRLNGVRVETVVDPGLQEAFVDAEQMQQLVINLLRNAAEGIETSRTNPGWIWVRIRRDRSRHVMEFLVEDNGPGLPPGREGRIFEPGFSTHQGRAGFGLSAVHRIVRNHDGTVEATTRPGGGARVCVRLPAPDRADYPSRPPRHMP